MFLWPKIFLDPKFFWIQNFLDQKVFLGPKFLLPQKKILELNFFHFYLTQKILRTKNFIWIKRNLLTEFFFRPRIFFIWPKILLAPKILLGLQFFVWAHNCFGPRNFCGPKFFADPKYLSAQKFPSDKMFCWTQYFLGLWEFH